MILKLTFSVKYELEAIQMFNCMSFGEKIVE